MHEKSPLGRALLYFLKVPEFKKGLRSSNILHLHIFSPHNVPPVLNLAGAQSQDVYITGPTTEHDLHHVLNAIIGPL